MTDTETLLSTHRFFKGIHEWYVEQMARYAHLREFDPGDYLLREGADADHFFLILEGDVKVGTHYRDGFFTIQRFGSHDIVGSSWLLPPHKWQFDAMADKSTKAIVLDGKYLRAKCEEDPQLGYEILKRLMHHMTQRLNALRRKAVQRLE